jgi:phenylacetic acid degradation operon negative regulatory protein
VGPLVSAAGGVADDATDAAALYSSQQLLVTLVSDYWFATAEPIPSAALVALLTEFGVTETGGRAALSRVARGGLLERTRSGRTTAYRLTGAAVDAIWAGADVLVKFTRRDDSPERPAWDGRWTTVTYSLPEEQRDTRPLVRSRLRMLGFAPLYDGVWVSPFRRDEPAEKVLVQLGVASYTVFHGASARHGAGLSPLEAFDLASIAERYDRLNERLDDARRRMLEGELTPSAALIARTELMDRWRQFPRHDPALPRELLPADWPGWQARRLFNEVYDGLGPLAVSRVREIVEPHSVAAARCASYHTMLPKRLVRPDC